MPSKTANKVLAIFFLVFGIGLVIFIVTQGSGLFKDSRTFVDGTAQPAIGCIKYFYAIERISYEGGELSFTVRNLAYSEDFGNLTVGVEGKEEQHLPVSIPKGTEQQIRLALEVTDTFTVYPEMCSVYKMTCRLENGTCLAK